MARFPPDAATAQTERNRLVDSLLTAADSAGRSVYLVATPLSPGEANRTAHRGLVAALAARFALDERVPIRADIDLRRITRKRT